MKVSKLIFFIFLFFLVCAVEILPDSVDHILAFSLLLYMLPRKMLYVDTIIMISLLALILFLNTNLSSTSSSAINYGFNLYLYLIPFLLYSFGRYFSRRFTYDLGLSVMKFIILYSSLNVVLTVADGALFGVSVSDVDSSVSFLRSSSFLFSSVVPQIYVTTLAFIYSLGLYKEWGRFSLVSTFLLGLGVLSSFSRVAILICLFAGFVYVYFKSKRIFILFLVGSITLAPFLSGSLIERFRALTVDYSVQNISSVGRGALLIGAVDIAVDKFPFGSGLASWGSPGAEVEYSPYYYFYGVDQVYGLEPDARERGRSFLVDSLLVQLLGELGFIGLMTYLLFLFQVVVRVGGYTSLYLRICLAFFALFSLVSSPFLINSSSYFSFWFVLGCLKGRNSFVNRF